MTKLQNISKDILKDNKTARVPALSQHGTSALASIDATRGTSSRQENVPDNVSDNILEDIEDMTEPLAMNSSLTDARNESNRDAHYGQKSIVNKENKEVEQASQGPEGTADLMMLVLQRKESLETSAKELREFANSEYELLDDINGDLTRFIAEMPEDEEQMTIRQWVEHCANNCRDIVQQTYSELNRAILAEYDTAIKMIESIPSEEE